MSSRLMLSKAPAAITTTTTIRRTASASAFLTTPRLRRTLAGTSRLDHKESTSHNPDHYEVHKHKSDLIEKHKQGRAHWKPELASDSEEAVKADRATAEEAASSPSEATGQDTDAQAQAKSKSKEEALRRLQERTKAAAEETRKAGTSMHDGL